MRLLIREERRYHIKLVLIEKVKASSEKTAHLWKKHPLYTYTDIFFGEQGLSPRRQEVYEMSLG